MSASARSFRLRPGGPDDVPALCRLLNDIIHAGGLTMIERPMTVGEFVDHFFTEQIQISLMVAEAAGGDLLGFQVLTTHERLPDDWADIATFAAVSSHDAGVGSALFIETLEIARRYGLAAINATIRADNAGGLAYYDRLGFVTDMTEKGVPLKSGFRVDRVSKVFRLAAET